MKLVIGLILVCFASACATPSQPTYNGHSLQKYDDNTQYYHKDERSGFLLYTYMNLRKIPTVFVSKNDGAVWDCSQRFDEVAGQIARQKNKKIVPVPEHQKDVKVTGGNGSPTCTVKGYFKFEG